jgi:hypothetical protein
MPLEHLHRPALYEAAQCHGATGDATSSALLYPNRATPQRHLQVHLIKAWFEAIAKTVRTVRHGVPALPCRSSCSRLQIGAIVDYVWSSHRGRLEEQIAVIADADGELTPDTVETDRAGRTGPLPGRDWSSRRNRNSPWNEHGSVGPCFFRAARSVTATTAGLDGRNPTKQDARATSRAPPI